MKKLLTAVTGLLCLSQVYADVSLPPIMSDNMVLQKSKATTIFGMATPGEQVSVSFRINNNVPKASTLPTEIGCEHSLVAGPDSRWEIYVDLSKVSSSASPFDIIIKGKNTVTIKNVVVGEVWIGSGQSNMEKNVGKRPGQHPCFDWENVVELSLNSQIRMFTVNRQEANTPTEKYTGKWLIASPKTTANFSAAAYFFACELNEKLKMPVGMIHTSWGGTNVQQWMPADTLSKPEYAKALPGNRSKLFNGMIYPLRNYTVKGAIWYQGESNANPVWAPLYEEMFSDMIGSWRTLWKQPEMPFYFCQLASFQNPQKDPNENPVWSTLRNEQFKTLKNLPHTGMAVLSDIGESNDIHPRNKADVGRRLAYIALAKNYGLKIDYTGPVFERAEIKVNKMVVHFQTVGNTLKASPVPSEYPMIGDKKGKVQRNAPKSELEGFALCGEDGKWVWADAKITGNTIEVTSPAVPAPKQVRYNWGNYLFGNLFNEAGLPASPFTSENN